MCRPQAVTCALFIGCIGPHAHDRPMTSVLCQSDAIIQLFTSMR